MVDSAGEVGKPSVYSITPFISGNRFCLGIVTSRQTLMSPSLGMERVLFEISPQNQRKSLILNSRHGSNIILLTGGEGFELWHAGVGTENNTHPKRVNQGFQICTRDLIVVSQINLRRV